jgi:predicted adenylyl cyclase CyaB
MPFEVERKAWVRGPEGLLRALTASLGAPRETVKRDRYFIEPAASAAALGRRPLEFRLRQEEGPPEKSQAVVTSKARSLRPDGTEISDEIEFQISDPQAFERFALERLGWGVKVDKLKRTRTFAAPPLSLEVSEVEGLGWFFEVEALIEKKAKIPQAERMLDETFAKWAPFLGAVEPAPYTRLLLERGAQTPDR